MRDKYTQERRDRIGNLNRGKNFCCAFLDWP